MTVTVRSARVGAAPAVRVRVEMREADRLREDDEGAGAADGAAAASPLVPLLEDDFVTVLPSAETVMNVDWLIEHGLSTVLGLDDDRPAPNLTRQCRRARLRRIRRTSH